MKDCNKIYLSGNKGGDYVAITQSDEQEKISCCSIEIGHCCVVVLSSQVPIEFITSLFANFMLKNQDGFSRQTSDKLKDFAKEVMNYMNTDFVTERLSRINK
jgi:hypothetical protein